MIDLLVATTNQGKFAEVNAFLSKLPLRILSLRDLQNPPAVVEDGASFEANALKKARTLARFSGLLTLADDSGIEVDALGGAPGIYSARYCGEEGNDDANNRKLLSELAGVPAERRSARFVCALALCAPSSSDMKEWTVRESCEGRIAFTLTGSNGFGYDPLFVADGFARSFAELGEDVKNRLSHRARALAKLKAALMTKGFAD